MTLDQTDSSTGWLEGGDDIKGTTLIDDTHIEYNKKPTIKDHKVPRQKVVNLLIDQGDPLP